MPDDPNKRGRQDRSRTSRQKHEQAHRRRKARGTRSTRGSASRRRRSTSTRTRDATALLREDHQHVDEMFKAYDKARAATRKRALVEKICEALKAHTAVEEEIFYPAVRDALREDELMDEADVEHASAKELIAQLEAGRPGDDHYDAKVKVLGEYIRHHVKEEQREIFPKARKADLDLRELGERIRARKADFASDKRQGRRSKSLLRRLSIVG